MKDDIPSAPRYRIFDHTADLGIEIFGRLPQDLFANATFALFDLITDIRRIRARETGHLFVEGADWPELLVNYLRETLYLFNGEGLLIKRCIISDITPRSVVADVRGEKFHPSRHKIKKEIKAVTYHQSAMKETDSGWTGRIIFDV